MPNKTSNRGNSNKTRKSKNRGPRRTISQQMRNYYNKGRSFSPNSHGYVTPRGPIEVEL